MKLDPMMQRVLIGLLGCALCAAADKWLGNNPMVIGFGTYLMGYATKSHLDVRSPSAEPKVAP
jgi:hypothetical protein